MNLKQLQNDVVGYLEMGMPPQHESAKYYNKMINKAIKEINRKMKRFCPLCKKLFKNQKLRKEHLLLIHLILL